jgi:hypothetical protein
MDIVGHSTIKMAMNAYAHVTLEAKPTRSTGSASCSRRSRDPVEHWIARSTRRARKRPRPTNQEA